MAVLPIGMSGEAGGYQIERSLRFNSDDSAYLIRTPASAGNRKTWTWSAWIKRSKLGTRQQIFNARPGSSEVIEFTGANDTIGMFDYTGAVIYQLVTTQVFRDTSAWYHIVWVKDTTQATESNRMKLYVNGVQVTSFSSTSYPPLNSESHINNNVAHHLGTTETTDLFFNGYLTDINFIDGQALTPSSFGGTDSDTGVWKPKAYSGSYGTNGFYLKFADNSGTTSTTLGKDSSGNGNNWTPNNFSVTAGAGNDSLVDTPTPYGTDTGAGGQVRGNYATLNPLNGLGTISNGNLTQTNSNADHRAAAGTFGMSSGKWYWEVTLTTAGTNTAVGIAKTTVNFLSNQFVGQSADSWGYVASNGEKYNNNTNAAYGSSWNTSGTVIGVAFDADAGTLVFYRNNVSQGTAFTGLTSGPYVPALSTYQGSLVDCNFGQRPFAYTAPSGFKALCTTNLPTPTIGATSSTRADKYFNTVLRNGFGTSGGTVTTGFYPDLVWQKQRNGISDHYLANTINGGTKLLRTNSTAAEITDANWITAFSSTGFTQGSSDFGTGDTVAIWAWNANSGSSASNTAGSITSTVSANTTSGFSIVTWTGNGTIGATVGHGLGVVPSMVIFKNRSAVRDWFTYHSAYPTSGSNAYILKLNLTDAVVLDNRANRPWGAFSSSLLTLGSDDETNGSGNSMVAYCFAPVAGFSAFGSYTGNGSTDGPFIYTGFRPAFVMVKNASAINNWAILDTKRNPYNGMNERLHPNLSQATNTGAGIVLDAVSNGFKCRNSDALENGSGNTIIYAAFAENPFKYSLAR